MGLDIRTISTVGITIKEYERYGSYSRIHVLRDWVKDHYEDADGWVLLNHSDCDGGYISFSEFCITGTHDPIAWSDLDQLKQELTLLKDRREEMPEVVRAALDRLSELVFDGDPDDEGEVGILFFR